MAVQWELDKDEMKRGSLYEFDPAVIVIKPELNGRHDLPDISELIADIRERGQLQPVSVRSEDGKPVLVSGFSRWRAIAEINKTLAPEMRIRVKASYVRCNELEGYVMNYMENRRRNATTALDDAHQFAQFERWGKTPAEIAAMLGVKASYVTRMLKLVQATPEVQKAVSEGRIKPTAAASIATLSTEVQNAAVSGDGKVSAETVNSARGKVTKPSRAYVYNTLRALDNADTLSDEVKDFCKRLVRFMDGKRKTL
jgi:ParB/RepB/Spo0J family partition protein